MVRIIDGMVPMAFLCSTHMQGGVFWVDTISLIFIKDAPFLISMNEEEERRVIW